MLDRDGCLFSMKKNVSGHSGEKEDRRAVGREVWKSRHQCRPGQTGPSILEAQGKQERKRESEDGTDQKEASGEK